MQQSYQFTAQPHVAPAPGKNKYKQSKDDDVVLSLMSDKRVVRGNTYSTTRKLVVAETTQSLKKAVVSAKENVAKPGRSTFTFR